MCNLCMATSTFDPTRHLDENGNTTEVFAEISEAFDAAAGTWTGYSMSVGDTFQGNIDSFGDYDWVAIDLNAGETIDINLGAAGGDPISDTVLWVHDSNGNVLASDDDGGSGLYSALSFTATTTGTYYLEAGGYYHPGGTINGTYYPEYYAQGTYSLSVNSSSGGGGGANDGTFEELADYLTDGYWQDNGFSGHSFDTSGSNQLTVNLSALTSQGEQLALWALEAWEMVADIEFVQTGGSADISFFDDEDIGSGNFGAYATSSTIGGNTTSAEVHISTAWIDAYGYDIDDYSFQTYVHEIGHALGLGHQGPYNGNASYGSDEEFSNDSWQLSVMSYFSQSDNTDVIASYAGIITTQIADIVAIQNLYGAPGSSSATAGATTWGANSNLGGYLGSYFDAWENDTTNALYGGSDVTFTIYDQGGIDTLDIGFVSTGNNVDLSGGSFCDIDGLTGNIMIADGTVIEDLITGIGNDTIVGNNANNDFDSGDGDDSIITNDGVDRVYARDGDDTIIGGADRDRLFGAHGNDEIHGGGGNDRLLAGRGEDTVTGGDGNDRIEGGGWSDTISGQSGDDRLLAGRGVDSVRGGNGDDRIAGGRGVDRIFGEDGNDEIEGGGWRDFLNGGNGNDTILGGNGRDTIVGRDGDDLLTGARGNDRFEFNTGEDVDTITDFTVGEDMVYLDVGLWGSASDGAELISDFGSSSGTTVTFDFGGGDMLVFQDISDINSLADSFVLF